jgi:hypothetical protein
MRLAQDQRAFDQGGVAIGEDLGGCGIGTGGASEVAAVIARALLVRGSGFVNRVVRVGELGGRADEHTAVKIRIVEPHVHDVEHREQLLDGSSPASFWTARNHACDSHSSRRCTLRASGRPCLGNACRRSSWRRRPLR